MGIGTDIVEIPRVRQLLAQPTGERFMQRVLTPAEKRLADERQGRLAEFVSGRFAAKEAVVKALGCGIGRQVGFHDLEVMPDALGKPECAISAQARERTGLSDGARIHVSISHCDGHAVAYALIETGV